MCLCRGLQSILAARLCGESYQRWTFPRKQGFRTAFLYHVQELPKQFLRRKLPKVDVPKETKLSHRFSLPCTRIAQAILAAKVTKGGRSQGNKAFAVYPLGAFAGSIGEDFWNTMRHIWFVPLMLSVPAVPITSPKTR